MPTHRDVAHAWAHDLDKHMTGHHVFRSNRTIYSYGYHFPIARLLEENGRKIALFTTRDYSQSTSQHKSIVRNAITDEYEVVLVKDVSSRPCLQDFEANIAEAKDNVEKAKRARTRGELYLDSAQRMLDRANALHDVFGIGTHVTLDSLDTEIGNIVIRAAQARQEREKRERSEAEERFQRQHEARVKWVGGGTTPWYGFDRDGRSALLRVVGDQLETSQGVSVPLKHAIKAFEKARECRNLHRGWERNGTSIRVGDFTVSRIDAEGNITAGCHNIQWLEAARIAEQIGLFAPA